LMPIVMRTYLQGSSSPRDQRSSPRSGSKLLQELIVYRGSYLPVKDRSGSVPLPRRGVPCTGSSSCSLASQLRLPHPSVPHTRRQSSVTLSPSATRLLA